MIIKKTITEKIKDAFTDVNLIPKIERDGVIYNFYDESRSENQAKIWRDQINRRKGYFTIIDRRMVDDVITGRTWHVYDVYIAKNTGVD